MLVSPIFEPKVKPHRSLFRLALEVGESVPGAVWLTDRDREKWMDVYGQIEELGRMQIGELRQRYREVFGADTTFGWLVFPTIANECGVAKHYDRLPLYL